MPSLHLGVISQLVEKKIAPAFVKERAESRGYERFSVRPMLVENVQESPQGAQTGDESGCLFEIYRNVWENIEESYYLKLIS